MIKIDYKQEQRNYYSSLINSIDKQVKELKRKRKKHLQRLKNIL